MFVETGFVQVRKFAAFGKPVFVDRALAVCQEMTGNGVHDHLPLLAFFHVPLPEYGWFQVKVRRYSFRFTRVDVDHQRPAAISAARTVDRRADFVIQPMNHLVYLQVITGLQKAAKRMIFCIVLFTRQLDGVEVLGVNFIQWVIFNFSLQFSVSNWQL